MNPDLLQAIAGSPFAASDFARSLDRLFYTMVALCGFMTVVLCALIVGFCLRYRRGRETGGTIHAGGQRYLEYAWIGLPLLIFLGLFFWGANVFMQLQRLPDDALVIHGVGKQWMWKFYHAGGQGEINELHVPANRPVIMRLASEDVIHSFFVPAFRVKQDVVPGRYARTWFVAREPGVYRLFCAEYCGLEHSRMGGTVRVMAPEDYAAWLEQRRPDRSLAAAGEILFRNLGCSACHSPRSQTPAPALNGLYGRMVPLAGGATVRADLAYLRDAILLPEKHVAAGYKAIMPSFDGQVSEEQLLKLLGYLQSIGAAGAGAFRDATEAMP